VDRVARGEDEHRRIVARGAHAAAHREAVEVGQAEVEDERVGRCVCQ